MQSPPFLLSQGDTMQVLNGLRLAVDREDYTIQNVGDYHNIVTFPHGSPIIIKSHMPSEAECEAYIAEKIAMKEIPAKTMSGHCTCGTGQWVFVKTLDLVFECCIECHRALRPSIVQKINLEVLKDFDLEDIFGD